MSVYIWVIYRGDVKKMLVEVVEDGMALEFRTVGYGPGVDGSFRVKLAERLDIYEHFPRLKEGHTVELVGKEME